MIASLSENSPDIRGIAGLRGGRVFGGVEFDLLADGGTPPRTCTRLDEMPVGLDRRFVLQRREGR